MIKNRLTSSESKMQIAYIGHNDVRMLMTKLNH